MNLYIVLSEMYTESLNEKSIFCVESIIQVINKSKSILLVCCPVLRVVSVAHKQAEASLWLLQPAVWLNSRLSKVTKKRCIMLPGGFCLGETLSRLNVCFTSCRWRKWPGFEMESVMFFIRRVKRDAHSRGPVSSVFMTEMESMFGSFTSLGWFIVFPVCIYEERFVIWTHKGHIL